MPRPRRKRYAAGANPRRARLDGRSGRSASRAARIGGRCSSRAAVILLRPIVDGKLRRRGAGEHGVGFLPLALAGSRPPAPLLEAHDAGALYAPRGGIEHLEFEQTGPGNDFAAGWQAAGARHQVAAESIDLLGGIAD